MIGCLVASLAILVAVCWLVDGAIVEVRPVRRALPRNVRVRK